MIWRSIHYLQPSLALLLFLVIPLFFAFWFLDLYRKQKLTAFADPAILKDILLARNSLLFWIKSILGCSVWAFCTLALMQPIGNESYIKNEKEEHVSSKGIIRRKMHDILFLVDVSSSMTVPDARGGRTREEIAKEIVNLIIGQLQSENVSLLAFTSATLSIVPPTNDYLFARLMLRNLEINEGETAGTDLKQALEYATQLIMQMPTSNAKTLILLTDGEDTLLEGLQGIAQTQARQAIMDAIKPLLKEQVHIMIVGLGSTQGMQIPGVLYQNKPVTSALNEKLLLEMSQTANGPFFNSRALSSGQIAKKISDDIHRHSVSVTEERLMGHSSSTQLFDQYFQIPLGIAFLALAFLLILPDTLRKKNWSAT